MESFIKDLRYSLRTLRKNPGFVAVVLVTLALGIGANTAIFSVINAVLLRQLPFGEPDRIAVLLEIKDDREWLISPANYLDWRERNHVFAEMAIVQPAYLNLTGDGEPERVMGTRVSSDFFKVMGVAPVRGRAFLPEEGEAGNDKVVVLSHGLWQRRFGGDPEAVGRSVMIDSAPHKVIGVMPSDFRIAYLADPQAWVPRVITEEEKTSAIQRGTKKVRVMARLKPGATLGQARAEMSLIADQLAQEYPDVNTGWGVRVNGLFEDTISGVETNLLLVFGAVGVLLLVACANVTNLMLARSTSRSRESALRMALGAGRLRLASLSLAETLPLALGGGALGLLLAWWGAKVLIAMSPGTIVRLDEAGIDVTVLLFTLGVSLVCGVLIGLVPAFKASDAALLRTLNEGGARAGGAAHHHRLRNAVVTAQTALVLVLLVCGALLVESFRRIQQIDPGFETDDRLTFRVELPETKYAEMPQIVAFFQQLLERVERVPGVRNVAAVSTLPLHPLFFELHFLIEGRPEPEPGMTQMAGFDFATPGYFQTLGIPLLRGRFFTDQDTREAPPVMIVNDSMAKRYFPDGDPLGERISLAGPQGPWLEVVGVVGDVSYSGLEQGTRAEMYRPHTQMHFPLRYMNLVAWHQAGSVESLTSTLRTAVWDVDADLPISRIATLDKVAAESVGQRRFIMVILGVFAVVALILGAVGIYGVVSYSVGQRAQEVGVRIALGAEARDVKRWVVWKGLVPVLFGVVLGVLGALAASRLIASQLFGVGATDPLTYLGIALIMLAVALLASFFPARRATRIDPAILLRP